MHMHVCTHQYSCAEQKNPHKSTYAQIRETQTPRNTIIRLCEINLLKGVCQAVIGDHCDVWVIILLIRLVSQSDCNQTRDWIPLAIRLSVTIITTSLSLAPLLCKATLYDVLNHNPRFAGAWMLVCCQWVSFNSTLYSSLTSAIDAFQGERLQAAWAFDKTSCFRCVQGSSVKWPFSSGATYCP